MDQEEQKASVAFSKTWRERRPDLKNEDGEGENRVTISVRRRCYGQLLRKECNNPERREIPPFT